MKPIDIKESLKSHQLALDSGENMILCLVLVTTLQQVEVYAVVLLLIVKKKIETKPNFQIPRWPKGFYEVCPPSLWKQLGKWKMLVNRDKLNEE